MKDLIFLPHPIFSSKILVLATLIWDDWIVSFSSTPWTKGDMFIQILNSYVLIYK